MQPDDHVVLIADPLAHGHGKFLFVADDGRLVVHWADGLVRKHDAHELELLDIWKRAPIRNAA